MSDFNDVDMLQSAASSAAISRRRYVLSCAKASAVGLRQLATVSPLICLRF
jgi:hypothetical protein